MRIKSLFFCFLLLLWAGHALAQNQPNPMADIPPANPEDVASIDAIMHAVYDVISGPKGQERDWDRFRSLFYPGARLIPTGHQAGRSGGTALSPDDYIERANPFFMENGFFETEVARKVERYGYIAHAFSTYESRYLAEDPEPFTRGINSFQLLHDGSRWWVVTIYWQGESDDYPIPEQYLKSDG